jgi:hypothetical protein
VITSIVFDVAVLVDALDSDVYRRSQPSGVAFVLFDASSACCLFE